ncbi:hypothetical protein MRB53_016263 [Persea americana]|uniref:Uncharacterized protein n=1 Tax=Persea americana TaxID=3435 RepID=A0ACC2M2P0_PERAE|nr:hypothetical protein MRB53_016263 [Persea americana]
METLPFIDHMKSQPSWLLLLSSLGFLSLFKFTTSLLKWVYTTFLRPPKNLKNYGSWALVTGATDGIGKCMAFQLAQQGLHLILLGRNADKLRDVSDAIEAKFRETKIKKVVVDLAGDLTEGIEKIGGAIEGLDVGVLINCAGFADSRLRFFHEVDDEAMKSMVRVNIESTTKLTKVLLKGMKERKRGAIVNIGSGSAVINPCLPLSAVYAATKAYISQFSRGLYVEYKKSGIDVQCQIPFYVSTKMVGFKTQSFFTPSPEAYSQAAVRWIGWRIDDPLLTPYVPSELTDSQIMLFMLRQPQCSFHLKSSKAILNQLA